MKGCTETAKTSGYLLRLLEHLVELVNDHFGELAPGVAAKDQGRRVVEFERIGYRQDRPGAGAHPHRLVVHRPIHHIAVAGLLQQVERDRALGDIRAEPALGPPARQSRHHLGAFGDQPALVLLPQHILALGIGAAVADIFVAPPVQPLDDVGTGFEHRRVDVMGARQGELVEQVEVMPKTDAVAVIAPRIVAMALGRRRPGRITAEPGAEREMLDVVVEGDGEPLALGPVVLRPLGGSGRSRSGCAREVSSSFSTW